MAFNGTWKVDRNENYEKFMEQMGESQASSSLSDAVEWFRGTVFIYCISSTGINMVKRKLASHDNLKITLEQTGDQFHVKESSTFRSLEINFTLGVNFDYSQADGTELTVSTIPSDSRGIYILLWTNAERL